MKHYFNADAARKLGAQLGIDAEEYAAWVTPRVEDLEIKDRVGVFARGLADRLPQDYVEALDQIVPRLGPELQEGEGYFNHAFHLWPVSRFIEDYGLEHPGESLDAIEALTRAFTGEWAVRPFLERYPELAMERVHEWSRSDSRNVRRLASESIRPRLPWAAVYRPFTVDPSPVIPVLDRLFTDASPYVRTSVANNLNDIARTHPDLAVETVNRWLQANPQAKPVAERALRGLIKQSHPGALAAVGFGTSSELQLHDVTFPHHVHIGDNATLTASITNKGPGARDVLVDYRVHFLKKNGRRRPTAFRLGRYTIGPGDTVTVTKTHPFAVTGTRTYYPGAQAVSVVVNGAESTPVEFLLE